MMPKGVEHEDQVATYKDTVSMKIPMMPKGVGDIH